MSHPDYHLPSLVVLLLLVLSMATTSASEGPPLVPWPKSVKTDTGRMVLTTQGRITTREKDLLPLARIVADEIALITGVRLAVKQTDARGGDIVLALRAGLRGEEYRLSIAERAFVEGGGYDAVALGTATLLQALRIDGKGASLPRLTIEDRPRFPYRGAMLDVARKPYSLDTLRQCVQICRFYK